MLTFGIVVGVFGLLLFALIKKGIKERNRVLREDFKDAVKSEFQKDHNGAWAKYVPTPQDLVTYQQLFQNQQAQTNMSIMMQNSAFAGGGTNFIADFARLNSAIVAKSMRNRALALYRIIYFCQKIVEAIQSPYSETADVIEYSAELAFETKQALKIGALPYDIHQMNAMTIPPTTERFN